MSKKIHIPVVGSTMDSIVQSLNIAGTDIIGMFGANTSYEMSTVLASNDEKTYEKYQAILEGDNEYSVVNYVDKKGYIIPGSEVSVDKLKLICKEHSIKITANVEDADVFITNHYTESTIHDHSIPKNKLMMYIRNGYAITKYVNRHGIATGTDRINKWMVDEGVEHMLHDPKVSEILGTSLSYCESDSLPYDTYIYTGLALEILNRIVNESIPTISATRLVDESPNQVILTTDLLESIFSMYKNDEDRLLLQKILPTVRTDVNFELLWELAQEISEYSFNMRDKDFMYWWRNKFSTLGYKSMSAEQFVLEYHHDDSLTKVAFKYMEPKIRSEIQIYSRELYTFRVEIKEEYKKYYEN